MYIDQTLRGTCFDELLPDERFIWFGFLLLAGDNAIEGKISVTENTGFSFEQLSDLLKCDIELIQRAIDKMIKHDKIKVGKNNIIQITKWKKYQSEYQRQKEYRQATPENKINYRMSMGLYSSLRFNKGGRHWEKLVGYSLKELKIHLEKQFKDGMSWENMGAWHIDHIIPKSSFVFQSNTDLEFKKCWSLENLQPLWAIDNLQKYNKMPNDKDVGLQHGVTTEGYYMGCGVDRDIDIEEDKDKEKIIIKSPAYKLSELLLKKIKENNPNYKKPDLDNWSVHINRMIRIDKRKPDKIREVIDWCQQDNFWHKNILSTEKLRKQYDQLIVNMPKQKQDWRTT